MIQQEKLQDALRALQGMPPDALTDLVLRGQVSTLWNNLGIRQAHAAANMGAGVAAYKTAVAINAKNATAYMNMVLAYWELKDPALTTEMLEAAMRLAPDDAMPHLILAQRLIDKDDLASATTHLEHAKSRSAGSPQAQSFLNSQIAYIENARKSEQRFQARDSSHFTVKYDGGEDYAVWTRVLEILEDAYRDVGQRLGHFPNKPILVVLHTRESFHNATGGPAWSDGLYDPSLGRIKIPTQGALTDQAWLARVLRHEFVHALLDDRLKGHRIPQWLNEGLAMQLAGDSPPDIAALVRGEVRLINLAHLEGPWEACPRNMRWSPIWKGIPPRAILSIDSVWARCAICLTGCQKAMRFLQPSRIEYLFRTMIFNDGGWNRSINHSKAGEPKSSLQLRQLQTSDSDTAL